MGGTKKRKSKHHKKEATGNRANCTVIGKAPENVGVSQNAEGTSSNRQKIKSENSATITAKLKETLDNQANGVAVVKKTLGEHENGGTKVVEKPDCQDNGANKETLGNLKNGVTMVKEKTGKHENGGTMVAEAPNNQENGLTRVKETPANQDNGKTMLNVTLGDPENGVKITKDIPKKPENDMMTMVKGTFENRENGMSRVKVLPGNQNNGMTMVKNTPENQENVLTVVKTGPEHQINVVPMVITPENLENNTKMVKTTPQNKENVLAMDKKTLENQQSVPIVRSTAENRGSINKVKATPKNQENENTKIKESKNIKTSLVINEALENLANMKHPLENTWGFWLYTNLNKKNWTENQVELTHFDTVEDYWCLYHHMKLPSKLKLGQDYAVFKKGISPMWEDRVNKNGGRWLIGTERQPEMDRIWLDMVLLMIGGNFEDSDIICGAVVNVRGAKSRVSLWTQNKDEKGNMAIGRKLKEQLAVNIRLQFCAHNSNSALFVV